MNALVLGGYGVFGSIVCRELARRGHRVTVAGRDGARAAALAGTLGPPHAAVALDAREERACRRALEGHDVAVSCAGPFRAETTQAVVEACLDAGCHYVDIADDRDSLRFVERCGERFAARGRAAVPGCSSLPGVSAALAGVAAAGIDGAPVRARVTLYIGNDNAKGPAAIASMAGQVGRPIAAVQGVLRAGGGCARVPLPAPFGPRLACDFDGPEHDVLPRWLGVRHVEVKVGFELPLASRAFGLLAHVGVGPRAARWLSRLGNLTRGFGTSGGAVMAELSWTDGTSPTGLTRWAALVAPHDGQRMAALPCVLAVEALAGGGARTGALLPHELLGADGLVTALTREGFLLHRS